MDYIISLCDFGPNKEAYQNLWRTIGISCLSYALVLHPKVELPIKDNPIISAYAKHNEGV